MQELIDQHWTCEKCGARNQGDAYCWRCGIEFPQLADLRSAGMVRTIAEIAQSPEAPNMTPIKWTDTIPLGLDNIVTRTVGPAEIAQSPEHPAADCSASRETAARNDLSGQAYRCTCGRRRHDDFMTSRPDAAPPVRTGQGDYTRDLTPPIGVPVDWLFWIAVLVTCIVTGLLTMLLVDKLLP